MENISFDISDNISDVIILYTFWDIYEGRLMSL